MGLSDVYRRPILTYKDGSRAERVKPILICNIYVLTFWSKYIKFCMDLDTFIILCPALFPPKFLSNRLQTLAQWSLGFGEVCYDFSKIHHVHPDILRIFWVTMWIKVGPIIYMSAEAHEWLLNRGRLSEARRPTLRAPSTFIQLKYRGLYPIMFQCGASVAEGCSALNQHWVLDINSRTFQILTLS